MCGGFIYTNVALNLWQRQAMFMYRLALIFIWIVLKYLLFGSTSNFLNSIKKFNMFGCSDFYDNVYTYAT